jgi:hypothetical protein
MYGCGERACKRIMNMPQNEGNAMFTQSLLIAQIAQHRQAQTLSRAERWHRVFRPTTPGGITIQPVRCPVIDLPAIAAHTSPVEARVA